MTPSDNHGERLDKSRAYPGPHGKFYMWTGEKRPPKAGEFYLSGAVIEAHRSPGDMSHPYHIAHEVLRPRCLRCGQHTQ